MAGLSLLISVSAALDAAGPQFVRVMLDRIIPAAVEAAGTRAPASAVGPVPGPALVPFLWFGAAFLAFYLFRAALGYLAMYQSFAFTQGVVSDVRMRAYRHLLSLPVARFAMERSGSLTSRVVNDVNALEGMIQAGASRLAGQLFSIVVVAAILLITNWRLALVNLVVIPALAWITRRYQEPLRLAARAIRARVGGMTGTATEAIANIQVVKAFASENLEEERFGAENADYVRLNLDRRKDVGAMESLIALTANLGVGVLLLLGGWMTVRGSLTVGELAAFVMYQRQLQRPVMQVMFFNNQLQAGMAALERVSDLLDAEPESQGSADELPWGALEFRGVTFTYPTGTTPALDGLSLRVEEGQTAALVGSSGAGKSTATALIGRFYDPQGGVITIGGRDIREFTLPALRRAIAVVPQEPTLFSGSVEQNIGYADPDASPEQIRRAAELANAHRFIESLPQGYATEIGERGVRLSGGQKQRIAIARAILKNAHILILDEATSALDSESEAVIQDALDGLFARGSGLTSLVIAHRLSTIEGADVIHVLEGGRLVESGSHADLVRRGGRYAELREVQYRDELGVRAP